MGYGITDIIKIGTHAVLVLAVGAHFKEASQQLGIGRSTLWRKVKQFGIK